MSTTLSKGWFARNTEPFYAFIDVGGTRQWAEVQVVGKHEGPKLNTTTFRMCCISPIVGTAGFPMEMRIGAFSEDNHGDVIVEI